MSTSSATPSTKTPVGYVDGFVIPVQKSKLDAYQEQATIACRVWLEHGALDYIETVGDDLDADFGTPFGKLTSIKDDETVVFAWISYRSREHRDEVNAKVMADERIKAMCPDQNPDFEAPFDPGRMTYGGFRTLVSA